MAIRQDIGAEHEWFTGEDKDVQFTLFQADDATAQNIAGWALQWMVKTNRADPDASALITKTSGGGGIVLTTPASGICNVGVTGTDTASLRGGATYYHELRRTDALLNTVLSFGSFTLQQGVQHVLQAAA